MNIKFARNTDGQFERIPSLPTLPPGAECVKRIESPVDVLEKITYDEVNKDETEETHCITDPPVPKSVTAILTDGRCTVALLNGFCIGDGIQKLDFSTENQNGEMKSTIRLMDIDTRRFKVMDDKKALEYFFGK